MHVGSGKPGRLVTTLAMVFIRVANSFPSTPNTMEPQTVKIAPMFTISLSIWVLV